jgi:hypothetical protein
MTLRTVPAIAILGALVAFAGCGGSSPSNTGTTIATSTGTTTAPTTTDPTSSTDGGSELPKVALVNGVYTSRDKSYSFRPDPAWDSGIDSDQIYFATNSARTHTITLSSEPLAGLPANLKDFVDISMETAPEDITGFTLRSRTRITLPSGDKAERIEYTGSIDDSPVMHFLTLVTISAENAVTASFATPTTEFADAVKRVEPVLRTIDVH